MTTYFRGETGSAQKSAVIARIIQTKARIKPNRALVVGCGDGSDAQTLAKHFLCSVDAIDVKDYFTPNGDTAVCFHLMDACALTFADQSFDLVYSFHALEHIPNWQKALLEMRRVLRDGGVYCIGTPNRTRIAGYIGVPGYSLISKLRANLRDWGQRLRGRFYNEYGAHAGFTHSELEQMCAIIGSNQNIADDYYTAYYSRRPRIIGFIVAARLQHVAWPSVYILGTKA